MAWGKPSEEDVQTPSESVAEQRVRQIVREELALIAAKNLTQTDG